MYCKGWADTRRRQRGQDVYCGSLLAALLAQPLDPLLHVEVVELPLGELAVELDRAVGVAGLFERAGTPVEHVFGAVVVTRLKVVNRGLENLSGLVEEAGFVERLA